MKKKGAVPKRSVLGEVVSIPTPGGDVIRLGPGFPLTLIAGSCVIETEEIAREIALELADICSHLGMPYIFKASFDKANRTSIESFRGPGFEKGLDILSRVRDLGIPVISDIHEAQQARQAAEVLDILQIPAFLCRQTDLLVAAARTGKPVNLKKGQFLSPWDMRHAVKKVTSSGNSRVILTERGTALGYNNLVVDMRSFSIMRAFGCPVVYDATHSVQLPGGGDGCSSGQREFISPLLRAATAAGIDGIFMEVHPDPEKALCDGPNSYPLHKMPDLLKQLQLIHELVGEGVEC